MIPVIQIQAPGFPVLAFRTMGDRHCGRVVVLVHGFPDNGNAWVAIGQQLSRNSFVIIPDLPGAGDSMPGEQATSMEVMAQSIIAILDHLQVGQAVMAGHSMGGYTLMALAAMAPERCKGLGMVHSSAYADNEEKKELRRKSIALIRKGGKEAFVKQMVPGLFSEWAKRTMPEVIERETARGLQLKEESMISFYNAMINRPDRTEVLENTAVPVLWIIGKDDNAVPANASLRQATLPDISFVSVYKDCGHMSMTEHTEKLISDLEEFITYCYNQ